LSRCGKEEFSLSKLIEEILFLYEDEPFYREKITKSFQLRCPHLIRGHYIDFFQSIDNIISNAKFQAVGCAGTFSSGAALINIVKGRSLEEAEKISEDNIIKFLGRMPEQKIHCVTLAKRTLLKAIEKYRERNSLYLVQDKD